MRDGCHVVQHEEGVLLVGEADDLKDLTVGVGEDSRDHAAPLPLEALVVRRGLEVALMWHFIPWVVAVAVAIIA